MERLVCTCLIKWLKSDVFLQIERRPESEGHLKGVQDQRYTLPLPVHIVMSDQWTFHKHTHCSTLRHTRGASAPCVLTASVPEPLVGCWIQASRVRASVSALRTQPCIWQLHGTTYKRVHLSCCSCPNQFIPGVRLIDAFCPPSHSFLWEALAWHELLRSAYMCSCVRTFILSKQTYEILFLLHHRMLDNVFVF